MKILSSFIIFLLISSGSHAQNIIGAWEAHHTNEQGVDIKSVVMFADGYQVISVYEAKTGKFIHTNGGTWRLDGNTMTEKVEFDTDNSDRVGTEVSFQVEITDKTIGIVGSETILTRIDDGTPGQLQGAWLMSGRVKDGETQLRDTDQPRKTMKMLSGTRFQWIAYNTATKEFMGTGGGTYTTVDGKYTENIEFFSRDDNKAGLSLTFNYELIDGKWHHSGLSSKGDPIHEIWSVRE
ncbi:membrane or secreted protein [Fulvivirga lutimaris]|uniref:membrane or secreted protein n=1 Tax=Fulvivirga lutimaris TaxID=1819566 RepID=UPI0012BB8218|nr:membrane or secreted protein [Fulvivirga lutimaris]MTI40032.1 membrane or secreted protein [Fulvivirga lutimaris]